MVRSSQTCRPNCPSRSGYRPSSPSLWRQPLEIDRASGEIVGGEVLTSEISISGPYDDYNS
jgi:hypothetical protein